MNALKYHHWFFDFDGTLCDTEADIKDAWLATIRETGKACPNFERDYTTGPAIDTMVEILFPGEATDELKAAIRAGFVKNYDRGGFPKTVPYPWAEKWLADLRAAGAHVYICSNKRHCALEVLIHEKLKWDFVEGIYAPDMFPDRRLKKAEFLAFGMQEHGAAVEDTVMVGDTQGDVDAGRAVGVHTIACTWGYGHAFEGADEIRTPQPQLPNSYPLTPNP